MSKMTVSKGFDWSKRTILGGFSPRHGFVKANDLDAFVPEMWAADAVENLYEGWVFPGMVHRDFEDMIASFGDTVNTRNPNQIKANRKQHDLRSKTRSDATATNIAVKLNQWVYSSIILGDREQSLSFQELSARYIPEMTAGMVRMIDRCIAAQALRFRATAVGGLGQMSSSNAKQYMIDMRKKLNDNNLPEMNRNLGWANYSESKLQENDTFKSLEYNGNLTGEALRQAQIGALYGFNNFRSPNLPSVDSLSVATDAATTTTANTAAGATVVPVTAATNIQAGKYIMVAGDYTPLLVASVASLNVTVANPLKSATTSGAAVTIVTHCAVNQASAIAAGPLNAAVANGYPAGWSEGIVYDGSGTPNVGQLVGFAGHTAEYVIVETGTNLVYLDRPLEANVADNEVMGLGPAGDINWAFHRDAVTVVNRPLVLPLAGSGAISDRFSFNDVSARVVIAYNNELEGMEITIASLFGLKELDTNKGGVIWG